MDSVIIIVIALIGTIILFALIGLVAFLIAKKKYVVARMMLDEVKNLELGRLHDLQSLIHKIKIPESYEKDCMALEVLDVNHPDFGHIRNEIDLFSKIFAKYCHEYGNKENEEKAQAIFERSASVYDKYTRKAMEYNSLISIFFAKPYAYFAHMKKLPII